MIAYDRAPNNMGDTWRRYIENRIEPGGFARALLENDLLGAVKRADVRNARLLREHLDWLLEWMPHMAWGSRDRVQLWLEEVS